MPAPSQRRPGVLVAAALLVVALVGGFLWWRSRPGAVDPKVLVVGDSVTYMTATSINGELGQGFEVQYIARPGFRSIDLLPLFEQVLAQRKADGVPLRQAVFLVGYNDVLRDDLAQKTAIEKMVELSSRFECAVWLTLPARPGGQPAADPDFVAARAEAWNAQLGRLVGAHRNLHLVRDWERLVDSTPRDQLLMPDGVHPIPGGSRKLAEIEITALRTTCKGTA